MERAYVWTNIRLVSLRRSQGREDFSWTTTKSRIMLSAFTLGLCVFGVSNVFTRIIGRSEVTALSSTQTQNFWLHMSVGLSDSQVTKFWHHNFRGCVPIFPSCLCNPRARMQIKCTYESNRPKSFRRKSWKLQSSKRNFSKLFPPKNWRRYFWAAVSMSAPMHPSYLYQWHSVHPFHSGQHYLKHGLAIWMC